MFDCLVTKPFSVSKDVRRYHGHRFKWKNFNDTNRNMCGKISRTANRLVVQACTHREKGWCKSTLCLAGMSHRVTGGSILVPELDRRSSYFILCNSFAFAVIRLYNWNPRPCYPRGPLSITGKLHYEGKDKPSSEKRFNRIQLNTEVA